MTETVPGGLQLAAVFDGVDPVTGPSFAPEHPRLAEGAERAAVLRYLRAGTAVLMTPMLADDVVDPSRRGVVPMAFRTDGEWIWTDTVGYYLEQYGLAPEARLLAHVRGKGAAQPVVPAPEVLERAVAFVLAPPEPDEVVWRVGPATG
ncbi:hypothetical protein [Kitasatospora azatica]|uniref:hypothetical protein n=1 Tax=Kitasatospora azatica TaxID=58347 RepID=UPI00068C2DE3|nr:hypothetical protein [Kitasatospora azatica]